MKFVNFENHEAIPYADAWELQTKYHQALVDQKLHLRAHPEHQPETYHKILFCTHPHVYTLGKSGDTNHLLINDEQLVEKKASFFKINRGGDITYHGPGQITGYPILDLEYIYTDIHRYIRDMEAAIISTILHFGIHGHRIEGLTGVWVKANDEHEADRKICAIGVHTSRWVTMHGFALNVKTDLSYFNNIVPCGIAQPDKEVTSIEKELGHKIEMEEVKPILLEHLLKVYGLTLIE